MKKVFNFFPIKALSLVFVLLFIAFSGYAQQHKSILKVGETLKVGERLWSPNSKNEWSPDTKYEFSTDLMLRERVAKFLWHFQSGSGTTPVAYLKLEEKGSLVAYDTAGKVLWSSNSDYPNVSELRLQDDGNLVIYDTNNEQIWTMKDPKTSRYDRNGGNGFFIKYTGPLPDPSRNSSNHVDLDDLEKKN